VSRPVQVILLVLVLAVIAVALVATRRNPTVAGLEPGEVRYFSNLGRDHVFGAVVYSVRPPVGGNHRPEWQNCGVYAQLIEDEAAVHSLEHGAVWLTYRPNLEANMVERIRTLANGHGYVIVSPYMGQREAVVATSWGAQLRLERFDEQKLTAFRVHFAGSQSVPEPGGACVGGRGEPITK
jgi:hypothetical protein